MTLPGTLTRILKSFFGKTHQVLYRWLRNASSIRLRFLLVSGLTVILVVALTHGIFERAIDKYLLDREAAEAEIISQAIIKNLQIEINIPTFSWVGADEYWQPYSGSYWQVVYDGDVVLRSRSLWDSQLAFRDLRSQHRAGFATGPDLEPLLLYERRFNFPDAALPIHVMVTRPLDQVEGAFREFYLSLYSATFMISIIMTLSLIACVLIGLFPLDRLRVALLEVSDGRKQRLEGNFAKELNPVITSFNIIIDRYGHLIERARVYGGNVAHGLKNPLAIIRLEIDSLNKQFSSDSLVVIEEQIAHMERHIQLELSRVRAAGARAVPGQSCEAVRQLNQLLTIINKLYLDRGINYQIGGNKMQVAIEEQDFKEIMGNCIDNAFKWAKERIVINLTQSKDIVVITIDDDGSGIPLQKRRKLFKPGVRIDENLTGTGLGLSIAKSLLQMYGGSIKLSGSRLGGLRVTINVPGTHLPTHEQSEGMIMSRAKK